MLSQSQSLLETVQDNKKSIASNRRTDLLIGAVEGLTIAGIFGSFLTKSAEAFLEKTGHYIFFPAAGLLNFIRTGLAFNQGRLEKWKNGTKEKAIVEAGSSVMVGTAVIGGLVEAPYAKFAPHIFTGMLAGKTGFHTAASVYYLGKSAGSADEAEKQHYKNVAHVNGIAAASLLLSTGATAAVMVLGETIGYAEVGLLANLFSAGYQLYSAYNIQIPTASISIDDDMMQDNVDDMENDHTTGQNRRPDYIQPVISSGSAAGIHRGLGTLPSVSPSSPSVNSQAPSNRDITPPRVNKVTTPTHGSTTTVTSTDRKTYSRV